MKKKTSLASVCIGRPGAAIVPAVMLFALACGGDIRPAWAVEWLEAAKDSSQTVETTSASEAVSSSEIKEPTGGNGESKSAIVRVLDKQTNRVHKLTVGVGQSVTSGSLTLTLKRCVFDYKRTPGLDAAWLDVIDEQAADAGFSGWMFNYYPAAATIENPRYDVTVAQCVLADGQNRYAPKTARVVKSSSRPEAVDEVPVEGGVVDGGAGSDPYYVPGVGDDKPAKPAADGNTSAGETSIGEPSPAPVTNEPAVDEPGEVVPVQPVPSAPAPASASDDQKELRRMMEDAGVDVFGQN